MEIIIDKNKKLSVIQSEFQNQFPFLKIEFYKQQHSQGEGSLKENKLDTELTIKEAQKKDISGIIKIQELMTVAALESAFAENYGLPIQVFRKSNKIWLQTTATDKWTLAEQNKNAMERHDTIEDNIVNSMDRQELE